MSTNMYILTPHKDTSICSSQRPNKTHQLIKMQRTTQSHLILLQHKPYTYCLNNVKRNFEKTVRAKRLEYLL